MGCEKKVKRNCYLFKNIWFPEFFTNQITFQEAKKGNLELKLLIF